MNNNSNLKNGKGISQNGWETQPRKKNGEFTYRHRSHLVENVIKNLNASLRDREIRKFTRGGSYGYLRTFTAGNRHYEIHHMPADSISPLTRWKGPCIIMGKEDHKFTGSYGRSVRAQRYRRWQDKLIAEGRFDEAQLMDIKNITRKFGDRYQKAIDEKLVYEAELEKKGVINGRA